MTPAPHSSVDLEELTSDRGQRFEVRARDDAGKEFVLGWTDSRAGSPLVELVNRHPKWSEPRVIDRRKA